MSLTRILCETCKIPLAFCQCKKAKEKEDKIKDMEGLKESDHSHFQEYSKLEYNCTNGNDAGYCDGKDAQRCQYYIDNENGQPACELAL